MQPEMKLTREGVTVGGTCGRVSQRWGMDELTSACLGSKFSRVELAQMQKNIKGGEIS